MHGTSGLSALFSLVQGGSVVTMPNRSFDAGALWRAVEETGATTITIVGDVFCTPMVDALDAAAAAGNPVDLTTLRQVTSSGVMWSRPIQDRLLAPPPSQGRTSRSPTRSERVRAWGSPLGSPKVTRRPRQPPSRSVPTPRCSRAMGFASKVAAMRLDCSLFLGLFRSVTTANPVKTAETFRVFEGQRWSVPGDWARLAADGTVTLLGRGSVSINTGGEKVFPEEVEEALKLLPEVLDATVVGVPDPTWGAAVAAVVSITPGISCADTDLIDALRSELSGYKLPKHIIRWARYFVAPTGRPTTRGRLRLPDAKPSSCRSRRMVIGMRRPNAAEHYLRIHGYGRKTSKSRMHYTTSSLTNSCPGPTWLPSASGAELEGIVADLGPRNSENLAHRDELQAKIDEWHRAHRDSFDAEAYTNFLRTIGYLNYMADDVSVATGNVDPEIASIAGPQLVVPLDNSRYALNAANARWGSFYDALYGTDAIDEGAGCTRGKKYNPIRGDQVIERVRDFLDHHFTLDQASHHWIVRYEVLNGDLVAVSGDGTRATLLRPDAFIAYTGQPDHPESILLRKNGLGLVMSFGEALYIGKRDHANIYDVHLESAVTAIMDCEDSVAAVDVADKLTVYGNWLGLMNGTLTRSFMKDGETVERSLESDRVFTAADGGEHVEPGRALMLVRNVGHHLTTDAVLFDGNEIPETFLDVMVTVAAALHDLQGSGPFRNSRTGSVYIVKPKMHGPVEVQLAVELFGRVEDAFGLDRNTLKMGIMDEEPSYLARPEGVYCCPRGNALSSSTQASSTAQAMRSTPTWRRAPSCRRVR